MGWANVGWPIVLTQILSLSIAGTAISSTYLAQSYSIDVPTLQSVLSYALLAFVYIPYYAIKGPLSLPDVIKETWWKYAALGFVEAEANYCIVKAYQFTSVTSVQMLDSCTIIFVLILSYFVLKRRYTWIHLFFVLLVFVGLGLMIYSDIKKADDGFSAKWKGCLLVVVACALYSISNVAVENLMATRQAARIEYLAQMSFWATIISFIQMMIFDRTELMNLAKTDHPGPVAGWLICFSLCLFIVYSLMPIAFNISSAVFVNLGLLTADIYALFVGIYLFDEIFDYLYLISFFIILSSLIGYHIESWRHEKQMNSLDQLRNVSCPDTSSNSSQRSKLINQMT